MIELKILLWACVVGALVAFVYEVLATRVKNAQRELRDEINKAEDNTRNLVYSATTNAKARTDALAAALGLRIDWIPETKTPARWDVKKRKRERG